MPKLDLPRDWGSRFLVLVLSVMLLLVFTHSQRFGDWREGLATGSVLTLLLLAILVALRLGAKDAIRAGELLSEVLDKHGAAERKSDAGLAAMARAAGERLDLYKAQVENASRDVYEETESKVHALMAANHVLLMHHRLTKRMLQSLNVEEIVKILLDGVRDQLGFTETIVGMLESEEGRLVFRNMRIIDDASPVRIPCFETDSLLARTFWNGVNVFLPTLEGQDVSADDRRVLGDGPAFLVPLVRDTEAGLTEVRECGLQSAGVMAAGDTRCWVRRSAKFQDLSLDEYRRARKGCAECPLFGPSAMLVVRSSKESGAVTRDSMSAVVSLAKEAQLAMNVVTLHHNLRMLAVTDGLTGLFNHREFYQSLRKEIERARRYRHTVSLMMIDLDDFKKFNDRFGHPAGDQALRELADLLRTCARATDIVARYGGEEFAIILPESTAEGALMLSERIRTVIDEHKFLAVRADEEGHHITVSIGIYSSYAGNDSEDQMVSLADEAAYRAKNSGKNRVIVRERGDVIKGNPNG